MLGWSRSILTLDYQEWDKATSHWAVATHVNSHFTYWMYTLKSIQYFSLHLVLSHLTHFILRFSFILFLLHVHFLVLLKIECRCRCRYQCQNSNSKSCKRDAKHTRIGLAKTIQSMVNWFKKKETKRNTPIFIVCFYRFRTHSLLLRIFLSIVLFFLPFLLIIFWHILFHHKSPCILAAQNEEKNGFVSNRFWMDSNCRWVQNGNENKNIWTTNLK